MKTLKVILIVLILILLGSCVENSSARIRYMQRDIPEIIEVFEQSREYLEILRNGQFANLGGSAGVNSGLVISYLESGGIPYERWDTIEWLSAEERGAILFLLRSEELSRNFTGIGTPTSDGVIVSTLYRSGGAGGTAMTAIEILSPGIEPRERDFFDLTDSYIIDLGDGYSLWAYTTQAQGGSGAIIFLVFLPIIIPAIIVISICVFIVMRYKKSKE